MTRTTRNQRAQLALIVLGGLVVRTLFLVWAGPIELRADEGQYVYQAIAWNRFGFYLGSPHWVWPPGYPAYIAPFTALFGEHGVVAAKFGQVLLSSVIGASIAFLALRTFSFAAARVATLLWAVYLPLIGFTHTMWPETVFLAALLPAIVLFLAALERPRERSAPCLELVGAGALLGIACSIKEAPLPLVVFLVAILVLAPPAGARRPLGERLGLAGVLVLSVAVVLVPWSIRTWEVYGRWVPSGSTLGENAYQGINTAYYNYDYAGLGAEKTVGVDGFVFRALLKPPAGVERWARSTKANAVDKNAENVERAKRFALEHPGFYARSRVKKLADWVSPLNFFQRHLRLNVYKTSLGSPLARWPLALASVALTMLVLGASIGGLFLTRIERARALVLAAVVVTFLAGIAVVSMSRYRVQVEPVLIVLAAGYLVHRGEHAATPLARRAALGCWVALAALWALNASEIVRVLGATLS